MPKRNLAIKTISRALRKWKLMKTRLISTPGLKFSGVWFPNRPGVNVPTDFRPEAGSSAAGLELMPGRVWELFTTASTRVTPLRRAVQHHRRVAGRGGSGGTRAGRVWFLCPRLPAVIHAFCSGRRDAGINHPTNDKVQPVRATLAVVARVVMQACASVCLQASFRCVWENTERSPRCAYGAPVTLIFQYLYLGQYNPTILVQFKWTSKHHNRQNRDGSYLHNFILLFGRGMVGYN